MRSIKFRAWDKIARIMKTGGMMFDNSTGNLIHDRNVIPMQFTGLLDKNGKEIYEGDVLGCWVKDLNGEPMMSFKHHVKDIREAPADGNCWWTEKGEVLGNIYSDPELLNN